MTARSSYPKSQGALGILGMHLCNNSIFLVRLQICSTTRPKLNWGQWQGRLKTRAKITQKSYALSLKGLAGLAVSAGCASPAAERLMEISIILSRSGHRDKGAPLLVQLRREPPRQPLCQGHWFRQTEIQPERALCAYLGLWRWVKNYGTFNPN